MTAVSPQIAEAAEGGRSYFDGDEHVLTVRIYYEDTDAGGVVYYANYLKFAERGRSALLRLGGWENGRLVRGDYAGQADGVAFVMRHFAADYLKSAVLDDLLEIRTRVVSVGGATLEMAQTIRRGAEVLVKAKAKLACVSAATQRPARMPEALRADMLARLAKE
ncbi:MAG: tol-pal system-associated acyl-CoA thioesterase [Rhodospirillaceae bacterium]